MITNTIFFFGGGVLIKGPKTQNPILIKAAILHSFLDLGLRMTSELCDLLRVGSLSVRDFFRGILFKVCMVCRFAPA